jgi:hypothetical protein
VLVLVVTLTPIGDAPIGNTVPPVAGTDDEPVPAIDPPETTALLLDVDEAVSPVAGIVVCFNLSLVVVPADCGPSGLTVEFEAPNRRT